MLVVDDDSSCVDSLSRALSVDGYAVIKAYGVSDAINILNFTAPDAIVTDNSMPAGGGQRVIDFAHSKYKNVPICVLSGSEQVLKDNCKQMTKPVNISDLISWLNDAIFGHSEDYAA